jgi:hypothetical protein
MADVIERTAMTSAATLLGEARCGCCTHFQLPGNPDFRPGGSHGYLGMGSCRVRRPVNPSDPFALDMKEKRVVQRAWPSCARFVWVGP